MQRVSELWRPVAGSPQVSVLISGWPVRAPAEKDLMLLEKPQKGISRTISGFHIVWGRV